MIIISFFFFFFFFFFIYSASEKQLERSKSALSYLQNQKVRNIK